MRAALVTGPQQLDLVEFDPPRPTPTGVVVDITLCGICGTDIASYRTGHLHSPAVCGHEWTGTISALGAEVDRFAEGDRVVIGVAPACGWCPECVAGQADSCRTVSQQVRGRDAAAPPHGGFAASIGVAADRVVPAHPDLSDEDAAQVEPAAVAYHGVRNSGVGLGDVVVVQGAGPIGLLTLQFARAAGATTLIVIEPTEHRRTLAGELGAHHTVTPDAAAEMVLDITAGRGADVVFECAGVAPLLQKAVDLTRRGGVTAMVGYIAGEATITPGAWLANNIRLAASTAFVHEDLHHTMSLIADGRVQVAPLHTRTVGLDELDSVLADLASGRADDTKVLVDPRVMDDLAGRIAVITGAASGLGLAMAERFAADGMHLVLADIEGDRLDEVAAGFAAAGVDVVAQRVDVSSADDIEALAGLAFERHGRVHVLCNNAGVVKRARTWALTADDWNWVLGVDLWSVIHGVRAFVPRMMTQPEGGHVVNTASMSGLLPIPNLAAYGVAKAAVVALSEMLQLDLDAEGANVGVSVLAPGYIATRIGDSGRNRPTELGDAASPPAAPRTIAGIEATMTADDVAGQVVDAIRTNRFWIVTHDRYREVIRERAAGIGTDARPAAPPIW